jgi:WD40 repeat protein
MMKDLIKLVGHKDVVSGVFFNPLAAQIATCSYDGSIKFYVDPTMGI